MPPTSYENDSVPKQLKFSAVLMSYVPTLRNDEGRGPVGAVRVRETGRFGLGDPFPPVGVLVFGRPAIHDDEAAPIFPTFRNGSGPRMRVTLEEKLGRSARSIAVRGPRAVCAFGAVADCYRGHG